MVAIPPEIQGVIQFLLERPEQTATAVVAVIGVLFNYRQTGNAPVGRLPWLYFRGLLDDLQDKYFGVTRPRGVKAIHVPEPPESVERALRSRHYESADVMGYHYEDEVWGLRRPSGLYRHPDTGERIPMETHPRGFRTEGDGTLILCHDEASRFEAPGDHLSETVMSWDRGRDIVTEDLDDLNKTYDVIESEASDSTVTVVPP